MIKKGFLLLFFWTFSIQSQSQEKVVWTTALEKVSDDTYLLKFEAKIKPKWHLYSQNLPDNGPLPTEFIFKGEEGHFDLVGNTKEGKSKTAYDPIFEMELSWFDDEALFEQKIKLLNPDLALIEGEINYQACDEKLCIFRNEAFRFVLDKSKQVIREKKVIDSGSLEKISALKLDLKNKHFINQNEQKKTDNSLLNLFLLGFIGGIIALLTPCVFPMIPLTVSFFLKQSKIEGKGLGQALLYSFFILVIYYFSF